MVQMRRLRLVGLEMERSTWYEVTPKALSKSLRHFASIEATFSMRKAISKFGKACWRQVKATGTEAARQDLG